MSNGGITVTKDWKQMREELGLEIPEEETAKIVPALEALERAFAPLRGKIPHETEPAVMFRVTRQEDGK